MRTFAEKRNQFVRLGAASVARSMAITSGRKNPINPILSLQQSIGNKAVQRLLQGATRELEAKRAITNFSPRAAPKILRKPTASAPGDIRVQDAEQASASGERAELQKKDLREGPLQPSSAGSGVLDKSSLSLMTGEVFRQSIELSARNLIAPLRSASDSPGRQIMRQPKPVETSFSGCTGTQSKQITAAVQDAKRALNRAAAVVGSAYGRPSGLSAAHRQLLMDHFHTTRHDDLREILGTYISVGQAFDSGLKFECETTCPKTKTEAVCGYAYNTMWFGGIGPIHICFDTSGCDFATTAADHQVALVIHEAAHRHAGVDDKVYAWAPGYATLTAKKAMDNADSYAWFAVLL